MNYYCQFTGRIYRGTENNKTTFSKIGIGGLFYYRKNFTYFYVYMSTPLRKDMKI